jgi:hypothetical protein
VHADYTARLEAVMGRLTGQVEGLRAELTTLATRIASLEEQQHRARDERAEAELRAHVGEMTTEEWEQASRKADALIDDLGRQHALAEDALVRTREFLAEAERPATPAEPAPPIPAAPAPAPGGTPTLQPPRGTTNVPVQAPARPSTGAPRLRPLPGREEPAVKPVSDAAEADMHVPVAEGQPAGGGQFDELAFLSSVVEQGAPQDSASTPPFAPPRAAAPAPTAAAHVQPVARPAPPPSRNPFAQRAQDKIINNDGAAGPKIESKRIGTTRSPLAASVSGENPIVLRDKSNESAKTLKCGECGAANYPTEWYCERCGAELASL